MSPSNDRLVALIEPVLGELGFDLEDLELTPAGKKRVLTIAVDKDGGVTLDEIADVTRAISPVLDDSDVLGTLPYLLEVTSRGVSRPLSLPRHWRRNKDRLVRVYLNDGTLIEERIRESNDLSVHLGTAEIAYADIESALIQVELGGRKS
ncbi:MAG: ribosome maturation factor RimP [Nocardioidaceae bacterium]|nr:ribosome maturation factor RimP [Nocardioidaceae bacterium]